LRTGEEEQRRTRCNDHSRWIDTEGQRSTFGCSCPLARHGLNCAPIRSERPYASCRPNSDISISHFLAVCCLQPLASHQSGHHESSQNMPKVAKADQSPSKDKPYSSSVKSEDAEEPSSPTKSPSKPRAIRESSSKNWTPEETWQLYQMIHPKPAEISWKEICKSFPGKDEQVSAANS